MEALGASCLPRSSCGSAADSY